MKNKHSFFKRKNNLLKGLDNNCSEHVLRSCDNIVKRLIRNCVFVGILWEREKKNEKKNRIEGLYIGAKLSV